MADKFSEEEGATILDGKTVYIQGNKEKLLELCRFFSELEKQIKENDICHMHFRDSCEKWEKGSYIDVAVELLNQ